MATVTLDKMTKAELRAHIAQLEQRVAAAEQALARRATPAAQAGKSFALRLKQYGLAHPHQRMQIRAEGAFVAGNLVVAR